MINDTFSPTGELHIFVRDTLTGQVKLDKHFKNLVVTTGKNYIASRMTDASATVMGWMAVGTSATGASNTDTALIGEVTRVALAVSGGTPTSNSVLYTATFPAGVGTGALQEAGLFNDVSAGTMLSRTTFAVINKGSSDEMIINWTVTVG